METVLYELRFNWIQSIFLLIPLIIGIGFFFIWKWYPLQNPGTEIKGAEGHGMYVVWKWIGWIGGIFLLLFFVSTAANHVQDYRSLKSDLQNNRALIAEGRVENFHGMPLSGHDTEHFELDGVYFEYSNFIVRNGYSRPACRRGVINHDGQHLRIKYVTDEAGSNIILYISELK